MSIPPQVPQQQQASSSSRVTLDFSEVEVQEVLKRRSQTRQAPADPPQIAARFGLDRVSLAHVACAATGIILTFIAKYYFENPPVIPACVGLRI
jgi:hypothetical protein